MSYVYLSELYSGPGDLTYAVCRLSDEYVYNFTSSVFENNASPAFQSMTEPSVAIYEGVIDNSIFASGVDYTIDYVDNALNKVVASSPLTNYSLIQYIPSGIQYVPSGVIQIVPSGYPEYIYVNVGGSTAVNNYTPPNSNIRYVGTLKPVGWNR